MLFTLSKEELERGSQIALSWTTEAYSLEQVYAEQENLNKQGYFTVIKELECDEYEEEKYVIEVYQRNEPLIQIG